MNLNSIRNKLIILFVIISMVIISITLIIFIQISKFNEIDTNKMDKIKSEYDMDEKYYEHVIFDLWDENWKELPLSNKFKKKFKNVSKIFSLNKSSIETIIPNDYMFYGFDECCNIDKRVVSCDVATGNGQERIAYKLHYIINDRYELDDLEVLETAPITRPDGSLVMYDKHLTLKNDYERIIEKLLYPTYVDLFAEGPFYNEVLPLSDNFKKKYPKYNTDGITNELGFNYAKYYSNYVEYHQSYEEAKKFKKDEDKNIFYGYTVFDDKMNIYKLSFILDKDNNIDDCIVELYKTEIGDFSDIFKDW